MRSYADYFGVLNMAGTGRGQGKRWDTSIYSKDVRDRVECGALANGVHWDEWSIMFT